MALIQGWAGDEELTNYYKLIKIHNIRRKFDLSNFLFQIDTKWHLKQGEYTACSSSDSNQPTSFARVISVSQTNRAQVLPPAHPFHSNKYCLVTYFIAFSKECRDGKYRRTEEVFILLLLLLVVVRFRQTI